VSHNLAAASAPAYPPTSSPSKIQAVGIIIPARNQSETIAKCIHSLFASNSHSGWRNSLWIVVVADACTDDTAKVARVALGAFGQVLEVSARSGQAAHQIGSRSVMEHFRDVPRHTLLLASADATAELPRDWIEAQLQCSGSPMALASNH
jgi:cellulose synthase/poly-beta-1,6-N-acetylglucosamine synthase-like glycosyltransferase